MVEKDDIWITKDDYLNVYIIGYENQGESIIISIGDKFIGVIDCYKVNNLFETKRILKEYGVPLDFVCWTHVDWDHTYGLSELREFINNSTAFIIPEGYTATEVRSMFLDSNNYKHKEYKKIYDTLDDISPDNFISANNNTEIYNFKFKYEEAEYDFLMKSFAPLSKIVRSLGSKNLKDTILGLKSKDDFGREWYEGYNRFNNLFSVGLEITLKLKFEDIRVCLTGDLDNETIDNMNPKAINRIFTRNTILKIPHHGSNNANKLIDFNYDKSIAFDYAVSTSFKSAGLPNSSILEKYNRYGNVYRTDKENCNKYGIVKYTYPIVNFQNKKDLPKELELFGDAGKVMSHQKAHQRVITK
ncbi:hypothetical protein [Clostridium sp.]|uniref:hypothetical protein n=1 Tax=Clostridium sp. TaxID=1506 RepID=UPI0025C5F6EB|nr:hypothetical protein [Clostridium sp.]